MIAVNPYQQMFNKSEVRKSFEIASEHYNCFTALQRTIGDKLLEQYLPNKRKEKAIDVGAGTGYLTKKITELGLVEDIFALDISQGMLRQTRQNMRAIHPAGLICADAESLSFESDSVDAVYSNLAFQWCSNLQQVFIESSRVLKRGGLFVFSTFGEKTLFELKDSWRMADEGVHVNSFVGVKEIEQNLKAVGFKNVTVYSENIEMFYDSPKQLMLGLKGMGAHNMNKNRKRSLTGARAFKEMLATYEIMRTKKGIPATFEAVYCYAKN